MVKAWHGQGQGKAIGGYGLDDGLQGNDGWMAGCTAWLQWPRLWAAIG